MDLGDYNDIEQNLEFVNKIFKNPLSFVHVVFFVDFVFDISPNEILNSSPFFNWVLIEKAGLGKASRPQQQLYLYPVRSISIQNWLTCLPSGSPIQRNVY